MGKFIDFVAGFALFTVVCFLWSILFGLFPRQLTFIEKQNIALTWLHENQNEWKYTLCRKESDK